MKDPGNEVAFPFLDMIIPLPFVSIFFNLKTPQCIFVLTLPSPDGAFSHFLGKNALN